MQEIKIETETIQLDQFLKWANLVGSGGQAKVMIKDEQVRVNGEVELRVRKKLSFGDIVTVEGLGSFKLIPAE